MRKSLEDRTYQFRLIQKKLLNRFKDKNPSALNNLDFLLNHTYGQVIDTCNQMETLKAEQAQVAVQLSNAVMTNNMLARIQTNMEEETFDVLNSFMSPDVDDALATETGWEEMILASTAHLLRTCLSRKEKQQNA